MSLIQAVEANDYEGVLRLLYLNPFIGIGEKSDAIWYCVENANLPLLRTLLDTKVDINQIEQPKVPSKLVSRYNSPGSVNTPLGLAIELGKQRNGSYWAVAKLLKKFDSSSQLCEIETKKPSCLTSKLHSRSDSNSIYSSDGKKKSYSAGSMAHSALPNHSEFVEASKSRSREGPVRSTTPGQIRLSPPDNPLERDVSFAGCPSSGERDHDVQSKGSRSRTPTQPTSRTEKSPTQPIARLVGNYFCGASTSSRAEPRSEPTKQPEKSHDKTSSSNAVKLGLDMSKVMIHDNVRNCFVQSKVRSTGRNRCENDCRNQTVGKQTSRQHQSKSKRTPRELVRTSRSPRPPDPVQEQVRLSIPPKPTLSGEAPTVQHVFEQDNPYSNEDDAFLHEAIGYIEAGDNRIDAFSPSEGFSSSDTSDGMHAWSPDTSASCWWTGGRVSRESNINRDAQLPMRQDATLVMGDSFPGKPTPSEHTNVAVNNSTGRSIAGAQDRRKSVERWSRQQVVEVNVFPTGSSISTSCSTPHQSVPNVKTVFKTDHYSRQTASTMQKATSSAAAFGRIPDELEEIVVTIASPRGVTPRGQNDSRNPFRDLTNHVQTGDNIWPWDGPGLNKDMHRGGVNKDVRSSKSTVAETAILIRDAPSALGKCASVPQIEETKRLEAPPLPRSCSRAHAATRQHQVAEAEKALRSQEAEGTLRSKERSKDCGKERSSRSSSVRISKPVSSSKPVSLPGSDRRLPTSSLLSDNEICIVCQVERRDVVFIPCGHLCCCRNCSARIGQSCPICRKTIQHTNLVFR